MTRSAGRVHAHLSNLHSYIIARCALERARQCDVAERVCVHEVVTKLEREVVLTGLGTAARYHADGLPSIAVAPRTHDIILFNDIVEIIGPQPRKGEIFNIE